LRSWSLVKLGTSAAQKKLFYNLKKIKARLGLYDNKDLAPQEVKAIARELVVDESDVKEMNILRRTDEEFQATILPNGIKLFGKLHTDVFFLAGQMDENTLVIPAKLRLGGHIVLIFLALMVDQQYGNGVPVRLTLYTLKYIFFHETSFA
jgi:RNA polymerase sigma-32 factor